MKHIMVIDDDVHIGNMIEETLRKEGYQVSRAYSGTEALLCLSKLKPDVILLDLMLPGLCGEEIIPLISNIPIIVISAKIDVSDKVAVLLKGAMDYISKPFDMSELLARISVQLRSKKIENHDKLYFRDIVVDTRTHEVYVQGVLVKLTKTEFAILKKLMKQPTIVITKSEMLDDISEDTPDCMESSLKVHVSNLRRKLRMIGNKDYIEAVWGIGFKMQEETFTKS